MSSTTTRLSLYKPANGEDVNVVTDLNNNLDQIDLNMNFRSCTSTTRPSTVWAGLGIWETDTNRTYVSNGTAPASASWINIPNGVDWGVVNLEGAASGTDTFMVKVTGDTQSRYVINANGALEWGSGSATVDTNLYRSAADTLRTDDNFSIGGTLTATGTTTLNGSVTVTGSSTLGAVTATSLSINNQRPPYMVYKTSDTDRASTTTATADPALTTSLEASSVYLVEIYILYGGLQAADIKTAWSVPSGATGNRATIGTSSTVTATVANADGVSSRYTTAGLTTTFSYPCATNAIGTLQGMLESAIVTTSSAGTLALTWAQNVSNATATRVAAGSWMRVTKIA